MTRDFRPSQQQLINLNDDMLDRLSDLGMNTMQYEFFIQSIDWYDWDNDPRWFVHILKYDRGKKVGYVEVVMWVYQWNGSENSLDLDRVEMAGHGYPCSCVEVAAYDSELDEYEIFE